MAELAVVGIVMGLFRWMPMKEASLVASIVFVLLGIWMLMRLERPNKYRQFSYHFTYLHLFLFSIPLFVFRITHWEKTLSQAHLLGVPGPLIHKAATYVYFGLMVATIVDAARAFLAERK